MAVHKKLKYNQLIEMLMSKDNQESMIMDTMRRYFHPKAPKNGFQYVSFGIKIIRSMVLIENRDRVQAVQKMIHFVKKQIKMVMKESVSRPSLKEKSWECLTNLWKSTKSLIEMDSDVDFSEFASWLLKFIIDHGAENRFFTPENKLFNIEENFSFIDDQFGSYSSLDLAMKLKSVIQPTFRKYKVVFPIARYVFMYQNKRSNIEKFLKVALLAKVLLIKSRNGSKKAKTLLKLFFMKAVLPSDFFPWADQHLNIKVPKGKKMQREKNLQYILKNLNCSQTYQILYKKNNETKCEDDEGNRNIKTLKSEKKNQKDMQLNTSTAQQNPFEIEGKHSSIFYSSSGPVLIIPSKYSVQKENPCKDFIVNSITKSKSIPEVNTRSVTVLNLPHKKNISGQERRNLEKHSETSLGLEREFLVNCKDSSNFGEHTKEKNSTKKRKRNRSKKKKATKHELELEEPSQKKIKTTIKSNVDFNSVLESAAAEVIVQPHKARLICLPVEDRSKINSKLNPKRNCKEKSPIVSYKMEGNETAANDVEKENNISKPTLLPNKGNKKWKKENVVLDIPKDRFIEKHTGKGKLENNTSAQKIEKNSSSLTYEHYDKASNKILNKVINNDCDHSSNVFLKKLDAPASASDSASPSAESLIKLSKKCRRRAPKSSRFEKCSRQQNGIEPEIVNSLPTLREKTNKRMCSEIESIEGRKTSSAKKKKDKESEVDEASGSDSDIVPNDLENSMFTKEETRAYHQLQLKELKENEKRQKIKVIFGKVDDSQIFDSNGKLETDKAEGRKSILKCSIDSQDVLSSSSSSSSSSYKKTDPVKSEKKSKKSSESQNADDEKKLPYGNDKIEDLEIVFSTIKKDLKTKFAWDIKTELPSEEDSIISVPVKENPVPLKKRRGTNTECHPDNLFNIYSRNDDISIISCSEQSSSKVPNNKKVKKQDNNIRTKILPKHLDIPKKDLPSLSIKFNDGKKVLSHIDSSETNITESQKEDKIKRPCVTSSEENWVALDRETKIGDFMKQINSLTHTPNAKSSDGNQDKQVSNDDDDDDDDDQQQLQDLSVILNESEKRKVEDGFTGSEVKTLDTLQPTTFTISEGPKSCKNKEVLPHNSNDREKSSSQTIDESSEDVCKNKTITLNGKEGSFQNIKLSDTKDIAQNISNEFVPRENLETLSTFESDCEIESSSSASKKKITLEQRNFTNKVEDKYMNNTKISKNETEEDSSDDINIIPGKLSGTSVFTENNRPDVEIVSQKAENFIPESVDYVSKNILDISNEKISVEQKREKVNVGEDENPVDDILKFNKPPHRKALTFEFREISSEREPEMSKSDDVSKLEKQNKENLENKENIVNNKQEEIVELLFVSSNSNNKLSEGNENNSHSFKESPKIKLTKYKSPAKRKSFVEKSPALMNNVICLTPLKVASAALSSEIIISPDVSDEENTGRAINIHLEEEENIIPSISESIVTLNQSSHEEEQIRDENENSSSNNTTGFLSSEDEIHTKIFTEKDTDQENENLIHSFSSSEVLVLSPISITSPQTKQSPCSVIPPMSKPSDLLQEQETPNTSTTSPSVVGSNVTRKSPVIVTKKSIDKHSVCALGGDIESTGTTILRKPKYSDNSLESVEELERKDIVPSPIKTRYSLRKPRNLTTPEKEITIPLRRRRNSVSSVKSENEIEVLKTSSPSAKSRRLSIAGNLTPVRRSTRISELSSDKN